MAKRFPIKRERVLDLSNYDQAFNAESDRGKVIIGTARLDDLLWLLISNTLTGEDKSIDELFTGPYAPFQSFGTKISIAYCLGLISTTERNNLKLIQAIRNAFSHNLHDVSFENEWVMGRCKEFVFHKSLSVDAAVSESQRFRIAVYQLDLELQFRIEEAPEPRDIAREVKWESHGGKYATIEGYA